MVCQGKNWQSDRRKMSKLSSLAPPEIRDASSYVRLRAVLSIATEVWISHASCNGSYWLSFVNLFVDDVATERNEIGHKIFSIPFALAVLHELRSPLSCLSTDTAGNSAES